jgi:hypothetical protein
VGQAVKKTQRGQQTVVFMDEDGAEHHFDDAAASTTARSVAASPAGGPKKKKKTQATAKPKLARRRAAPKPFPDLQVDESEDTQPTSTASAMSELAAPQTRKKATTARASAAATAAGGVGGRAAPQKQVLVRRSLRILMKQNPQVKSRFAALTQPPAMWTGTAGSPHLAPSSLPVSHTPAAPACMHTRRRARPARTSREEGGVE